MRTASALLLGLGIMAAAGSAQAQSDPQAIIERGQTSFRLYCVQCHGESATGDGPMAAMLTVHPANLTKLRTPDDKEFPFARIFKVVEGDSGVRGHGGSKMPLWGPAFADRKSSMINELVYYLESIQRVK